MKELFQFRCAVRYCACEDFFESFEFQEGPVRPRDFERAVAEEKQPRRADESTLLALVGCDRHQTHGKTAARQRFRWTALFVRTAHQNWWWVPGGRIAQPPCRTVIDAVPDGEIKGVLMFHLE